MPVVSLRSTFTFILMLFLAGCQCSTSNSILCSRHNDQNSCQQDSRCVVKTTPCLTGADCPAACDSDGKQCYNTKPRCIGSYAGTNKMKCINKQPGNGAVCDLMETKEKRFEYVCTDLKGRETRACKYGEKNGVTVCVSPSGSTEGCQRIGKMVDRIIPHCIERNPLIDCSKCKPGFLTCQGKSVCRGVICL